MEGGVGDNEGDSNECGACGPASSDIDCDQFWILCDCCQCWFHGRCVDVEEYESALIDRYHCPKCTHVHGASVLKVYRCDHRYDFDLSDQDHLPVQIGTRRFIRQFCNSQQFIHEVCQRLVPRLSDGFKFNEQFDRRQVWTKPYLIEKADGLNLRMPDVGFTVEDCVEIMGEELLVDTIDVYKQHTYHMSLGRFLKLWQREERRRLYNVLSLECSHSKLSELVKPPSIVNELSWVERFWPDSVQEANLSQSDVSFEHLRAKPTVALFCLISMADSFTDFHVDFGGSSVWYHVLKGRKVFYLIEPTKTNLALFEQYQQMERRSEVFFPQLLSGDQHQVWAGSLQLLQGQTLLLPAGWIHAVWTPQDSLVFGGNFLHSLNIPLQLRVYEMELKCNTDERFLFPFFELTNWYAANSLYETLKDKNEDGRVADSHLIRGIRALIPALRTWLYNKNQKTKNKQLAMSFGNVIQKLGRELNRQEKLRHRKSMAAVSQSVTKRKLSSLTIQTNRNKNAQEIGQLKLKFVLDKNNKTVGTMPLTSVICQSSDGHITHGKVSNDIKEQCAAELDILAVEEGNNRIVEINESNVESVENLEENKDEKLSVNESKEAETVQMTFSSESDSVDQLAESVQQAPSRHQFSDWQSSADEMGKRQVSIVIGTAKKIAPQMAGKSRAMKRKKKKKITSLTDRCIIESERGASTGQGNAKAKERKMKASTTKKRLAIKLNLKNLVVRRS